MNERCWWTYSVSADEVVLERTADRSVAVAACLYAVEGLLLRFGAGYRLWSRIIEWCDAPPRRVEVLRLPVTAEQRRALFGVLPTDGMAVDGS